MKNTERKKHTESKCIYFRRTENDIRYPIHVYIHKCNVTQNVRMCIITFAVLSFSYTFWVYAMWIDTVLGILVVYNGFGSSVDINAHVPDAVDIYWATSTLLSASLFGVSFWVRVCTLVFDSVHESFFLSSSFLFFVFSLSPPLCPENEKNSKDIFATDHIAKALYCEDDVNVHIILIRLYLSASPSSSSAYALQFGARIFSCVYLCTMFTMDPYIYVCIANTVWNHVESLSLLLL